MRLRVLIVEDSEDHAKLLVRFLTKQGFEVVWERVCTEERHAGIAAEGFLGRDPI